MKIATWNINGVKARIDNLLTWLKEAEPDVVCLQEIKSTDDQFPRLEIEALGYHVETHGQKGFNGVALLSRQMPDEINRGLPGEDADEQARFIEGVYPFGDRIVRVVSLYLPNDSPRGKETSPSGVTPRSIHSPGACSPPHPGARAASASAAARAALRGMDSRQAHA